MSHWSDILDASVAGGDQPRHLQALHLPTLDHWERGRVRATCEVEPELLTPVVGSLFGGYIAAVADHVLANALFTILEESETLVTAELHVHFFRPARTGVLDVEARVVTRGKTSAYCEAGIHDQEGRLIARAGATQSIRRVASPP